MLVRVLLTGMFKMLFLKKIGKGAYARLIPHGLIGYTPYGCHTGRTPLYPLGSSQTGFVYVRQFYFQPSVTFGYARSALYGVFPLSLRGLPSPSTEAIDRLLSDLSLSLFLPHTPTHTPPPLIHPTLQLDRLRSRIPITFISRGNGRARLA